MTQCRRRYRGFSLAELAMVMFILAMLAAIAAPRVANSIRRQRLDMASRRLMIDLELTRSQAIRDGANRTLTLSLAGQYYTLPTEAGMGSSSRVNLDAAPYDGVSLKATTFAPAQVVFDRLGLPVPAASGSITLEAGPEQVTITISAASGRATRTFGS